MYHISKFVYVLSCLHINFICFAHYVTLFTRNSSCICQLKLTDDQNKLFQLASHCTVWYFIWCCFSILLTADKSLRCSVIKKETAVCMFVKLLVTLSNSLQLIRGYVSWEQLNREHMSHEYTASGLTWTSQTQVTQPDSLRNTKCLQPVSCSLLSTSSGNCIMIPSRFQVENYPKPLHWPLVARGIASWT